MGKYEFVFTFFEQAGVDEEDEKAADRRSGQCPRNSEQLHPACLWGRFVADRQSRAALVGLVERGGVEGGDIHSKSARRQALVHSQLAV